MAISALNVLDIIEIILFTPTFCISWLVVRRHEAGRMLEWRFLLLVSLFRIIGGAVGIASTNSDSGGIDQASDILPSLALPFLLATAVGILTRVNQSMWKKAFPSKIIEALSLPLLGGFIINIIGTTKIFRDTSSDHVIGYSLLKAASAVFAAIFFVIAAIAIHNVLIISHVEHGDRYLVFGVAASLPLLAVRVGYEMICAFTEDSRWFNTHSTFVGAVAIQAILASLPELVAVAMYVFAGLTTQVVSVQPAAQEAEMVRREPEAKEEGTIATDVGVRD